MRRPQCPFTQAALEMVNDVVAQAGGRSVLLQNTPHSGRPADKVPVGERNRDSEEDVPGEDSPVAVVSDASWPGSRRGWELRRVDVHTVSAEETTQLGFTMWRSVDNMPHDTATLLSVYNRRITRPPAKNYRIITLSVFRRSRPWRLTGRGSITGSSPSVLSGRTAGHLPEPAL